MRALITVAVFLLLLVACNCTAHAPPYDSVNYTDALTERRFKTTVRIAGWCGPMNVRVGTGVIGPKGMIYTARHVIECSDGTDPIIMAEYYTKERFLIITTWKSPDHDVAILEPFAWVNKEGPVEFEMEAPLRLSRLRIGEKLYYLGGGGDPSLKIEKHGVVFRVEPDEIGVGFLTVGGNSGGPLFDSRGRLVGIITKRDLTDTAGYAVPLRAVLGAS